MVELSINISFVDIERGQYLPEICCMIVYHITRTFSINRVLVGDLEMVCVALAMLPVSPVWSCACGVW